MAETGTLFFSASGFLLRVMRGQLCSGCAIADISDAVCFFG